jgi:hypothetical protein
MFGDTVLRQYTISTNPSLFALIENFSDDRKAKSNTKRTIYYNERTYTKNCGII